MSVFGSTPRHISQFYLSEAESCEKMLHLLHQRSKGLPSRELLIKIKLKGALGIDTKNFNWLLSVKIPQTGISKEGKGNKKRES